MKKLFSIIFLLFAASGLVNAQESLEETLKFKLPPIDTLFKGALKSSMVEFYDIRAEGEKLLLKSEKKKWLEYFSLGGTYQYGIIGMNSYMDLGDNYPLIYQYTGQEQVFYNIGATLRVPLDRIFDQRNRVKRQELRIKELSRERDVWYDEQKAKIIDLYFKCQEMINSYKPLLEQVLLSDEQFNQNQNDYIYGKISIHELNVAKGLQVQARLQLERLISELKSSVMKLEIISNTTILNN